MELTTIKAAHRLVRSCFPPTGILDTISEPDDLEAITELENLTNDRLASQFGNIFFLPKEDWVVGVPNATVIMAAYCYPRPFGGRFNDSSLGAWYASFKLETAFKELTFHIKKELQEVKQFTPIELRQYLSDFKDHFIDARADNWKVLGIYADDCYTESQKFAQEHRLKGAAGIIYNSVRDNGGSCIACFKPKKVLNVRQGKHFRINWDDHEEPIISTLGIE